MCSSQLSSPLRYPEVETVRLLDLFDLFLFRLSTLWGAWGRLNPSTHDRIWSKRTFFQSFKVSEGNIGKRCSYVDSHYFR